MSVRIKPLLKYELKNMGFTFLVGMVLLFIFDFTTFLNTFNDIFIDLMRYDRFYSYLSCFSVVVVANVIFVLLLSFLQFLNIKKDFLSSLPYTRIKLLMAKNIVGYGIILLKNVILLAGMLIIYSRWKWLLEDISFYFSNISNFELSSPGNIFMLALASVVMEISVYSILCFCYSVAGGVKRGIGLIICGIMFFTAADNICSEYNLIYNIELFNIDNFICYGWWIVFVFALIYGIFTALSYRYFMNRKIEIAYLIFPYKITVVMLVIMLSTIISALSFVTTLQMTVAVFVTSIILITLFLRFIYKKQGGIK